MDATALTFHGLVSGLPLLMNLSNIDWQALLLGYPILLLSLSVHECAHAWTANRLGDPTARLLGRVTLNPIAHIDIFGTVLFPIISIITRFPLIGWAKPVPVNLLHLRRPSRDNMLISVAGPASNLVLAGFFFAVFAVFLSAAPEDMSKNLAQPIAIILWHGTLINILLMLFNLIPIHPLDGSHVLEHFLPYEARQMFNQARQFGFIAILLLFYLGLTGLIFRPVIGLINDLVLLLPGHYKLFTWLG